MPVDVRRLLPGVDATQVTAAQIREFIQRLMAAGEHLPGDPEFLFNMDACYDVARLALLLAELPVILIARVRSNRVFYAPGGARSGSSKGRPPRHGAKLSLKDPATHPAPTYASEHDLDRYVCVLVQAFSRMHPERDTRGGIADEQGRSVVLEGTMIGVQIQHLAGGQAPKPMWLWASKPVAQNVAEMDHWWSMYLRRFDLEHTFRFLKQTLGWTKPKLHDP